MTTLSYSSFVAAVRSSSLAAWDAGLTGLAAVEPDVAVTLSVIFHLAVELAEVAFACPLAFVVDPSASVVAAVAADQASLAG